MYYSDVANEEVIEPSGCTTEPIVENQQAESILPVSISVQCTLISLGIAFTISRFMDDPKAMLCLCVFEDYDQFSQSSGIMMKMTANLKCRCTLLSLEDQLFLNACASGKN